MSPPTLSVIIPNFNGAPYLEQALSAILHQSVRVSEIIIVDDDSTDDSLQIIDRFRRNSASIHLLRNAENHGVIYSVRRGIEVSRGDFFHGAAIDDLVAPNFYDESMHLLEQFPQAGLCSGLSRVIEEKGSEIRSERTRPISRKETYCSSPDVLQLLQSRGSWFWGNTTIYRRSAYEALGGFKTEFGSYCDNVLSQAIALKFGACYIPRFLGAWRRLQTGYASQTMRQSDDLVLSLISRISDWMRNQPNHLFPEDYVLLWRRRELLELARRRIVSQPADPQGAVDMIDAKLDPKTGWDKLAIGMMRRFPPLRRPLLKVLKNYQWTFMNIQRRNY